jgi:RNA polymerase sigma factor (sigma-70 family)
MGGTSEFRLRLRLACETYRRSSGTVRVMEPVVSDVDCLARSLSEPEAFELIFERHFDAIHKYLHRRVGRDLADEIAAETFAAAFERRASCRAGDSALPWLYGIATNLLRRRFRAERRQLQAYARHGVDRGVVYEDEAEARADGSAFGGRLASALAAMRPRERDALLLYALCDLSYDEIALALDVPVGTVRTWLHRARRAAQRVLATETNFFPLATSGAELNE